VHYAITALIGVYLLAASLQAWYFGKADKPLRAVLLAGSLLLISGGLMTDLIGIGLAVIAAVWQFMKNKKLVTAP